MALVIRERLPRKLGSDHRTMLGICQESFRRFEFSNLSTDEKSQIESSLEVILGEDLNKPFLDNVSSETIESEIGH